MRPLDRMESFRTIAQMFKVAKEITVAAPYFGEGAANQLGLEGTEAAVVVVCDLFSGGCNPREIMRIARLPSKPKVKRLAGLHAKIYLTETAVVIGSANPSSNGLGFEGKELIGNIEACVHSEDPEIVAAWRVFLENNILPLAKDVTAKDIENATLLYRTRRENRMRGERRTLLDVMRNEKDYLKDKPIYFTYYSRIDTSPEQDKMIDDRNAALGTDNISAYFDWPEAPKPGSFIVDFQTTKRTTQGGFQGFWRVVEQDHFLKLRDGTALFVYEVEDVQGLTISLEDQKYFRKLLKNHFAELSDLPTAYEVAALV